MEAKKTNLFGWWESNFKNKVLHFFNETLKQMHETAFGTKCTQQRLMAALETKILSLVKKKPSVSLIFWLNIFLSKIVVKNH